MLTSLYIGLDTYKQAQNLAHANQLTLNEILVRTLVAKAWLIALSNCNRTRRAKFGEIC